MSREIISIMSVPALSRLCSGILSIEWTKSMKEYVVFDLHNKKNLDSLAYRPVELKAIGEHWLKNYILIS